MIEAILAFLIPDRKVFPRCVAIRRREIGVVRREINHVDLRVHVVHRNADLQVVAQQAIGFYSPKDMP
jgi:hypothetical protein